MPEVTLETASLPPDRGMPVYILPPNTPPLTGLGTVVVVQIIPQMSIIQHGTWTPNLMNKKHRMSKLISFQQVAAKSWPTLRLYD